MEFTQKQIDEIVRFRIGGRTAESLSQSYGISKSEQDEWMIDYVKRAINAAAEFKGADKSLCVPVFEHATDGTPSAERDAPIGYITLYDSGKDPKDYYGLIVRDDSMKPYIGFCSVALIKIQDKIRSGDLAAVQIGHGDYILRYVKASEAGLTIEAENKRFMPAFYTWQDVHKIPVRIIGTLEEIRTFF